MKIKIDKKQKIINVWDANYDQVRNFIDLLNKEIQLTYEFRLIPEKAIEEITMEIEFTNE